MSGSAAQQQDSPFSILVGCVKIPASTIAGILNRPCATQASALSTALDATSPVSTDPTLRVLINAAISIFEDEKQVVLELTTLLKGLTQGVAESGSTLTTSTTPKTVMASDSGFNVIGSSGVSVNIGPVSTTNNSNNTTHNNYNVSMPKSLDSQVVQRMIENRADAEDTERLCIEFKEIFGAPSTSKMLKDCAQHEELRN